MSSDFRGLIVRLIGVEPDPDLGPNGALGPDDMELPSRALMIDCEVCDRVRPFLREENGGCNVHSLPLHLAGLRRSK